MWHEDLGTGAKSMKDFVEKKNLLKAWHKKRQPGSQCLCPVHGHS